MSKVHFKGPVAIIGYGGQLGTDLKNICVEKNVPFKTVQIEDCDFSDINNVREFFPDFFEKIQPSIIINASAYTAVDKAEDNEEICYTINRAAVGILAQEAYQRKIPFIHYSTDYVFDGTAKSPYLETDKTNPLGIYGKSKLAGENEALLKNPDTIIIRTAWLMGSMVIISLRPCTNSCRKGKK